jgi:hypothetical protein
MKRTCIFLALAILATLATPLRAAADDAVVVVNKSSTVDTLTMAQLRKLLLGQDTQLGGKKVVIYLTPPGQPERGSALKAICGMTETDFNLHYMHAQFNGETAEPPKVAAGPAARKAVAAAPGGLAIIRAADADDTVKIIKINGIAPGAAGYPLTIK